MLVFFFVYIFFIQKKEKKRAPAEQFVWFPGLNPTAPPPPTTTPHPPTPPIPHGLELDENPEPGGFLVLRSSFRLPPKKPRRPPGGCLAARRRVALRPVVCATSLIIIFLLKTQGHVHTPSNRLRRHNIKHAV